MAKTSKAKTKTKTSQKRKVQAKAKTPGTRTNSKQAQLIEMLKSREGATIEEIVKKFDWQAHTVRGAIAGALKKKLELDVQSEKVEGRGRVYRLC
jgi:predicted ArsR family transcriptional regulator